jgi:hypothetical protein
LLGVLFSALLALALFHPSVAAAQEVKQIKLTEKHLQGLIAVSEDMAKLSDGANQDKLDAELEAQAETLVKRNGFANLAEFDDASTNISMIMSGIDQQTKKFTEPPEQIKQQIAAINAFLVPTSLLRQYGLLPSHLRSIGGDTFRLALRPRCALQPVPPLTLSYCVLGLPSPNVISLFEFLRWSQAHSASQGNFLLSQEGKGYRFVDYTFKV